MLTERMCGMQDKFKGQMLHSMQHKKATDHAGKKVVVIGACTAAHDICVDYADHDIGTFSLLSFSHFCSVSWY